MAQSEGPEPRSPEAGDPIDHLIVRIQDEHGKIRLGHVIRLLRLIEVRTALVLIGGLTVAVGTIWSMGYGAASWNKADWETTAKENNWVSPSEWQAEARRQGWMPTTECPAYPTKLVISSPGQNSELVAVQRYGSHYKISEDVVIESSRPLASADKFQVGLAFQPAGEPQSNCYLIFAFGSWSDDHKVYKFSWSMDLPFDASNVKQIDMWAVLLTDKNKLGNIYSSIEQIKNSGAVIAISDPIRVRLKPES